MGKLRVVSHHNDNCRIAATSTSSSVPIMNPTAAAAIKASIGLSRLAENRFALIRETIGDARVVLIGEETHGTQEFYALRAEITKALVEEEGFSLVLCESDFPTFYKLHQFVEGAHASSASQRSPSSSSSTSLSPSRSPSPGSPILSPTAATPLLTGADHRVGDYGTSTSQPLPSVESSPRVTTEEVMEVLKVRFPVWMWRNEVVRDFVEWLHRENLDRQLHSSTDQVREQHAIPVALFGLDIFSMFSSTDQVVNYLDAVDPVMAKRARQRYSVLQRFRPHEEQYCRAVDHGQVPAQHNPVKKMLDELNSKATEFKNVFGDRDEYFSAHENARVVMAAEEYYRQSYLGGGTQTWNIRDKAMVELIVNALQLHDEKLVELGRGNARARAVVWAHNSHIGDAQATEQYEKWGQVNVGHLVRALVGKEHCFLLGLSTATGKVRAARRWNGRDHVMELNPPLSGSVGDILHQVAVARASRGDDADFGLIFHDKRKEKRKETAGIPAAFATPLLERFVGVQYIKDSERAAHYTSCCLSEQFDMVIHLEKTTALRPLREVAEPHLPSMSVRPGTVDYSKWDRFQVDDDENDDDDEGC